MQLSPIHMADKSEPKNEAKHGNMIEIMQELQGGGGGGGDVT